MFCWIFGINYLEAVELNEDNQACLTFSKGSTVSQRSKHIDIRYHFVRDAIQFNEVNVKYCPTEEMLADILTKPATHVVLQKYKDVLGLEFNHA